jgi:hypothetical protein
MGSLPMLKWEYCFDDLIDEGGLSRYPLINFRIDNEVGTACAPWNGFLFTFHRLNA